MKMLVKEEFFLLLWMYNILSSFNKRSPSSSFSLSVAPSPTARPRPPSAEDRNWTSRVSASTLPCNVARVASLVSSVASN